MKRFAMICCFILALSVAAGATIEKMAVPCKTGLCLYWWPKLPHVNGWHQDKGASFHYSINALAPNGSSFANAPAVMYAKANFKPRVPNIKSLQMFIANDKRESLSSNPNIVITRVPDAVTGDGARMPSFTFFPRSPKSQGNWEQVSYGEEGKYYLVFTLSARSKASFEKSLPAYSHLIAHYKSKLQPPPIAPRRQLHPLLFGPVAHRSPLAAFRPPASSSQASPLKLPTNHHIAAKPARESSSPTAPREVIPRSEPAITPLWKRKLNAQDKSAYFGQA